MSELQLLTQEAIDDFRKDFADWIEQLLRKLPTLLDTAELALKATANV